MLKPATNSDFYCSGRRLSLRFTGETPRLTAIEFQWSLNIKGARWDEVPDHTHEKSPKLDTPLPSALADFFVAFAAFTAGNQESSFSYVEQSKAETIRNARDAKGQYFHKVFVNEGPNSCFRGLFIGSGLARPKKSRTPKRATHKRPHPIVLRLDQTILPSDCLEIAWDKFPKGPLKSAKQLCQLLFALRGDGAAAVKSLPGNPHPTKPIRLPDGPHRELSDLTPPSVPPGNDERDDLKNVVGYASVPQAQTVLRDHAAAYREAIDRMRASQPPHRLLLAGASLTEFVHMATYQLRQLARAEQCAEIKIILKKPELVWSQRTSVGMCFLPPPRHTDSLQMCKESRLDLQRLLAYSQSFPCSVEARECTWPPTYVFAYFEYENYAWTLFEPIIHGTPRAERLCFVFITVAKPPDHELVTRLLNGFESLWNQSTPIEMQ